MKGFAKFVGSLPFSGKYRIRKWSFRFYNSTTPAQRRKQYYILLIMLLCDVTIHSALAVLGAIFISNSVPAWGNLVFGLYFVANASCATVQAYILRRASRFYFNRRSPYPRAARSLPAYTVSGRVVAIMVTAVGQAIFIIAALLYHT